MTEQLIVTMDCFRCGKNREHSKIGVAYVDAGSFTNEYGEPEKNDEDQIWFLQCGQCQLLSLWEMIPDFSSPPGHDLNHKRKPGHCLFRQLTDRSGINFSKLNIKPDLVKTLKIRESEVNMCLSQGAWLAAIIMMGSLLEGLLLAVMERNMAIAMTSKSSPKQYKGGPTKPLGDWQLGELIDVAHDLHWLDKTMRDQSLVIRELRNLVHPREFVKIQNINISESTAQISRIVLIESCSQLSKHLS